VSAPDLVRELFEAVRSLVDCDHGHPLTVTHDTPSGPACMRLCLDCGMLLPPDASRETILVRPARLARLVDAACRRVPEADRAAVLDVLFDLQQQLARAVRPPKE
jgi:hypothetical protein